MFLHISSRVDWSRSGSKGRVFHSLQLRSGLRGVFLSFHFDVRREQSHDGKCSTAKNNHMGMLLRPSCCASASAKRQQNATQLRHGALGAVALTRPGLVKMTGNTCIEASEVICVWPPSSYYRRRHDVTIHHIISIVSVHQAADCFTHTCEDLVIVALVTQYFTFKH